MNKEQFESEFGISPDTECISCGEKAIDLHKRHIYLVEDAPPTTDKGWVCGGCIEQDESEPCATVIYGDRPEEPCTVGDYHDTTDGDFRVKWHSTDAWRGYYEVESDTYEKVHDDCILSGSRDAEELKDFDDKLREHCDKQGIRYARVFTRTSNVFSQGYDFFVHKEDVKEVKKWMLVAVVIGLRARYRDSERFKLIALTGKDAHDTKDKILGKAYDLIEAGTDFDDVKEFVEKAVSEEAGE